MHDHVHSSMHGGEFCGQLRDPQFYKKNTTPWDCFKMAQFIGLSFWSGFNIKILTTYTDQGSSFLIFFLTQQPPRGPGPPHSRDFQITHSTHHSRQDSSGRVIHDIHASVGIGTHNLSRRATADLRLRPRGHWDRQTDQVREAKLSSVPSWELKQDACNIQPLIQTFY